MKKIMITTLAISVLSGCSANKDKVRRVLERDGYADIEVGGWSAFGCSKDDAFTNTFRARKYDMLVTGYVCSGFLKGYTIRVSGD